MSILCKVFGHRIDWVRKDKAQYMAEFKQWRDVYGLLIDKTPPGKPPAPPPQPSQHELRCLRCGER